MTNKIFKVEKYKCDGETIKFKFFVNISPLERTVLVRNIVSSLVVVDQGVKWYNSQLREVFTLFYIIGCYTDISLKDVMANYYSKDWGYDEIYDWLYNKSNIAEIITKEYDNIPIYEIEQDINYNIQIQTGIAINDISVQFNGLIKSLMEQVKNSDVAAIADFAKKFSKAEKNLTPESIWNAYMQTGAFNNTLKAIKEDK